MMMRLSVVIGLCVMSVMGCRERREASVIASADTNVKADELSPAEKDFVTPSFLIEIREGATKPTVDDVLIKKSFDGRSPEEVVAVIRSKQQESLHPANVRFVEGIITSSHKSWLLAVQNAFVPMANPTKDLINGLLAEGSRVEVIGVMSAINPVWIRATAGDKETYYQKEMGTPWKKEAMPRTADGSSFYHQLMVAEVRQTPSPGIKVSYLPWSDPRLSQDLKSSFTVMESPTKNPKPNEATTEGAR